MRDLTPEQEAELDQAADHGAELPTEVELLSVPYTWLSNDGPQRSIRHYQRVVGSDRWYVRTGRGWDPVMSPAVADLLDFCSRQGIADIELI